MTKQGCIQEPALSTIFLLECIRTVGDSYLNLECMSASCQTELDTLSWMTGECSSLMQLTCTVWPENLAGIKFGTSNSAILNNNYVSLLSDRLSAHAYKHENGVTNEAIVIEWAAVAAW